MTREEIILEHHIDPVLQEREARRQEYYRALAPRNPNEISDEQALRHRPVGTLSDGALDHPIDLRHCLVGTLLDEYSRCQGESLQTGDRLDHTFTAELTRRVSSDGRHRGQLPSMKIVLESRRMHKTYVELVNGRREHQGLSPLSDDELSQLVQPL